MSSLVHKFADLLDPNPKFEDPENDEDDTIAKLTSKYTEEDDVEEKNTSSTIRRRATGLLSDSDKRYSGKTVSRKTLIEGDSVSEDGDDDDEVDGDSLEGNDVDQLSEGDEEVSENEEEDEMDLENFRLEVGNKKQTTKSDFKVGARKDFSQFGEGSDSSGEDEEGSGEEDDSEDDEEEEGEEDMSGEEDEGSDEEGDGSPQNFSKSSINEEIEKGKAAKAQLGLWDSFLENRIKLQKSVVLVNQLPQPADWDLFVQECGTEYQAALVEGQRYMKRVLDQLTHLQTSLLNKNPETRSLVSGDTRSQVSGKEEAAKQHSNQDDDDEEITSESEAEDSNHDNKADVKSLKRKLSTADYPGFLAKRHTDFQHYRNDVIQKWYDKTRVVTGKISKGFGAFDQSALKQIEQIMSDQDRLIKRTQLRRTAYTILGRVDSKPNLPADREEEPMEEELDQLPSRDILKDYDPQIFDDDDFYHQLLRELIERKTSDTNDPVALSRQWLEIQKLRNKTKKKVDTKASKGRKVRHDLHKKLVNFMAPYDKTWWTDEARNELYKSLFGRGSTQPEDTLTR